jgi:hypothetical protein
MARVTTLRAPAWLTATALMMPLGLGILPRASAQTQMVGPPMMMGGAQPMWVGQAPAFQVGADGAVNIDQPITMAGPQFGGAPMMMPQAAAPMYCGPDGYPCPPCPDPCAPQPCPTPTMWMVPAQPCPPPAPPPLRWSIFGDVLWIHPTGVDMAHAQQQDGLGGAGTVPFGEIGVVDPDYDLGFRVGGEVRLSADAGVFVAFTLFESDATSSVVAPTIPGGGGAVGSLVHHPNASITASAGPVNADYDIKFLLGDVAYRQILWRTCVHYVSVFAGARFAQLDQEFLQSGTFGGGQGGVVDTSTFIEFTGIGPMAGIDGARQIGTTRFSVYGRSLLAAISGEFDSRYRMFNRTTSVLLAESMWKDDRIMPMLDYEIGVAWTSPQGHLRLAAGYMVSHWFNVVSTPTWVDAVQADNYVDVDDTLSFDGVVGRVEWIF